ncbi:hypothetical protein DFH07DRAFT_951541 [Mycena maculata]|uniref:Uncharacterized protein n=1 Tax=Mycena maculata TaxID=230809 RepID=A0AAD7K285_9AGAR|nr:hypothetical protein DFH07DRAFT_951541 [Mycena maculata]
MATFPQVDIEHGLTEEDALWTENRETEEHAAERAQTVLDQIFRDDKNAICVIPVIIEATSSITTSTKFV